MRVILVTTAARPGGVWRHVLDLAGGLGERGHEVRIGARSGSVELVEAARERSVETLPLARALLAPTDVWHLHLHATYDTAALPLLLARRAVPGTIVLTEHLPRSNASDSSLLPGPRRRGAASAKWLLKRAEARLCRRVVVLGAGSARFMVERYGLAPPQVVTVRNGVVVAADPGPRQREDGRLHVLAVGALGMQKGHDVLVEACALARGPWAATVVGDGGARERLEERAAAVARGRIAFAGWRDDVEQELRAADCLCLPSRWEACPYAALEAMALGRPVVAAAVDGLDEIVADGRTGLLVPPEDPRALAGALDALARDPARCERLGRAAHERVRREFPLERMLEETLAVYREALGV